MSRTSLIWLAALGSAALLAGAFAFQYLGGLAPCAMCIWQRYPHVLAVLLGPLALANPSVAAFGALSVLTSGAIGVFHVGVEQAWWEGPSTCSSGDIGGLSTDALMDQILSAPLVRCDEIAWSMAGISMAGWNAIASGVLAILWIAALRRA